MKIEHLYQDEHLENLHQDFLRFLKGKDSQNFSQFSSLHENYPKSDKSQILIETSKVLEEFLVKYFKIEENNENLRQKHQNLQKIYVARREFVQRSVSRKFKEAPNANYSAILEKLKIAENIDIDELEINLAAKILPLIEKKELNETEKSELELLEQYAALALYDQKTKFKHRDGALFVVPQKIDHQNLVNQNPAQRNREDFNLTDQGYNLNKALGETHYCIFCHKQEKDSCRTGIKEKNSTEFKKDPLGIQLHGCPLDEKISEMNLLKSEGFSIAALAMAVIDNPMIAGTGHRICNDCMKSCIYQKQDPVDIPQAETRILKDVLSLPFGFEIYSLLTRWNPLNIERPLPKPKSGKKVLIVGLGPAGYTLAHHLLNEGHEIVAIDGLKIEPLNPEISGVDGFGKRCNFRSINHLDEIYEPLSTRLLHGFGGVAEYGITARFDKNFLKIIRLLLERRKNFSMFGGIRFGSSITDEIALNEYGFDHVALCIGAGRPRIIDIKNNFAKGIRSASDFLMSLQLTGAYKEELFTNLQIRLPIVVIGGGLTAVDTACEASAYYIVQVRKFAKKIEILGKEKVFATLNQEEKNIAEEFLLHAKELENSSSTEFFNKFGHTKILYRRKIQDSPAYRLNHQELNKAFEENIEFVENIMPIEAELDEFGAVYSLKCADGKNFACRSVLVAAGTTPNISPVLEDGIKLELNPRTYHQHFEIIDENGSKLPDIFDPKSENISFLTKIDEKSGKAVSFFGDLHPTFEGNVVKAMASAKIGYKQINKILAKTPHRAVRSNLPLEGCEESGLVHTNSEYFFNKIHNDFFTKILKIERITNHVIEITIKAPLLARQTQVGQIFRLQNYHSLAKKVGDQLMAMEGVAVTALNIDKTAGTISGIVLETGGSTSLIRNFKNGEPCVFMGPSGKPNEIPKNKNVLFVGGGRGNQPLTALAEAYEANGCKVFFFAGYRKNSYIARQSRMENSCHQIIYAIEEEAPNLALEKSSTLTFHGNVIEAIKDFFAKNSPKIDMIFALGNDRLLEAVAKLRHDNVVKELVEAPLAIASLNAPMQCMLKGVCSQCLQKRKNDRGEIEYFYSCADQDQDMDRIDFQHLHYRCEQNSLMEKITKLWITNLKI